MKKFWLVLLSLGLVMAFSVSAFAVDVKVSGEYYAAGLYLNKTSVNDGHEGEDNDRSNPSTAFYFQRLRVGTDFIVSPCLKLVTRFDAMERIWGGQRSPGYGGSPDGFSAGTRAENENIAFDLAYIDYTAPVGQFRVGYQKESTWGTIFGNKGESTPTGQIRYDGTFGNFSVIAMIAKMTDNSYSAITDEDQTDHDSDSYRVGGIYRFNNDKVKGEAGVLLIYGRDATHKYEDSTGHWGHAYMARTYTVNPYFKTAIGPVALQGEAMYAFGDAKDYEGIVNHHTDKKFDSLRVFLDAAANFGIFNVGGTFAYLSGDDPSTRDKIEGGDTAGVDWNPCLIMFNNDVVSYWVGGIEGHGDSVIGGSMSNAWFGQGRVGVKPMPQFDIVASLSYATADKKPDPYDTHGHHAYANNGYGFEIDVVGTYKITNNLSYMLGAGYLFTGDYYKGYDWDADSKVNDDFILINKLTLTF
jgi:hypothetical protein